MRQRDFGLRTSDFGQTVIACALTAMLGCHGHRGAETASAKIDPSATIVTLYSDAAMVEQAVGFEGAGDGPVEVKAEIPIDVDPRDLVIVERAAFAISAVRGPIVVEPVEETTEVDTYTDFDQALQEAPKPPSPLPLAEVRSPKSEAHPPSEARPHPHVVTFTARAPRGHHVVHLAYRTGTLVWNAAYTVTTTAARTRATVRGALAIANTGVALHAVRLFVVDAAVQAVQNRRREQLAAALVGATPAADPPPVVPRALGVVDLAVGQSRVELLPDAPSRPLRAVLVYDPFGDTLDNKKLEPITVASLGAHAAGRVMESLEIERPRAGGDGLPAGPVRVIERRRDGTLGVLGEGRMFERGARIAAIDTIGLGEATGVTVVRERTELEVEDDERLPAEKRRVVEQFRATIVNKRSAPVEVVVREHAYRGQTWQLAFASVANARQEGVQQFTLRATAPANGRAQLDYTIVYLWKDLK